MEEKTHKKSRLGLYILLATILVIAMVAGVFVLHANKYVDEQEKKYDNRIFDDVYIEKLNVSGMTKDEAAKILSNHINAGINNRKITLTAGSVEKPVNVSAFKIKFDAEKAVQDAYDFGRSGNLVSRYFLYRKLEDEPEPVTIKLERTIDNKNVEKVLNDNKNVFNAKPVNASIKVTTKDGKRNIKIVPEKNGIKLVEDKSIQDLESFLNEKWNLEPSSVKMTVDTDVPKYTSKDFEEVKDVLGTYTTKFDYYYEDRKSEIKKSAKKLNNIILEPGQELSVYKKAGEYSKKYYGLALSQAASTLYNAVIRAELDVTERHANYSAPSFIDLSADAAVRDEGDDFKFKNSTDNIIYIHSTSTNSKVTFTIIGKETRDKNRKVKFASKTTAVIKAGTTRTKDNTLKKGKKVVAQEGINGYRAELWKTVYVDGKKTDEKKFNESSYTPVNKVVRIGTKVAKKKKAKKKVNSITRR